jgi:hypothetical protein
MVPKEQTSVNFEYDTLETVLSEVKRLVKEYGKDAKIMMRCESYSDSDKEYMYVYKDEPETDAETAKRIASEEEWSKRDDERDAAEFKRLQAKFGTK